MIRDALYLTWAEAEEAEIIKAQTRAGRRRQLYAGDPLWRLSKLKANRETRMRAKLRAA